LASDLKLNPSGATGLPVEQEKVNGLPENPVELID
jgi:hypothetical protein